MQDARTSGYGGMSGAHHAPLHTGFEVESDWAWASLSSAPAEDHILLSDFSRDLPRPASHRELHTRGGSLVSTATCLTTDTPLPSARGKQLRPGSLGLEYDTHNHYAVLTRMFGSVWPRIGHFCVANVLLTLVLVELQRREYRVAIDDNGHKFMSVLISFLVVSRVNIAYDRFMENARLMTDLFRNCRELVMNTMSYTRQFSSEASKVRRSLTRR